MMVKRMAVVAVVGLSLVTVGCSSSKKEAAKSAVSSVVSSSSTSAADGSNEATSTTAAGSSTGDSVAFCAAVKKMESLPENPTENDKATAIATIKDAAQGMRDNAPASIADSAKTYADLLDSVAAALGSAGSESDMTAALSKLGSGSTGADIVPVVKYMATNC